MTYELRVGDALDPFTGLWSLDEKSVDHTITDPPYEAEAHTLGRRSRTSPGNGSSNARVRPAPLQFDAITEAQRMAVARLIARVTRRWIVVFCQVEAAMKWRAALEAGGAVYKRTGVWVKPDGQPQLTGDRPGMGYESLVICYGEAGRSRWNGGGKRAVWTFHRCQDQLHQTGKPLDLMAALVEDFTDPGDLVVDPYAGSGSTGVAAIRAGRRFLGWELDPAYAEVARRRLGETREQLALPIGRPPKSKQAALTLDREEEHHADDPQAFMQAE